MSLGGASAKASSVRSVSPLPVRSEALAPAESKSSAVVISDVGRPLIALDWHKTISHERAGRRGSSFVPAGNITVLRRLQELGYDLVAASFLHSLPFCPKRVWLITTLARFRLQDIVERKPSLSGIWAAACSLTTSEIIAESQIYQEPLQGCGRCFRSFKFLAAAARRGGEEHSEVFEVLELG